MQGESIGVNGISWIDIASIPVLKNFNNDEIALLEILWNEMLQENSRPFFSVAEGISSLAIWLRERGERRRQALELQWIGDNLDRIAKEQRYHEVLDGYMGGNADNAALAAAMEEAYGPGTSAWKKHYQNLQRVMLGNITEYHLWGPDYANEFSILA